METSDKVRIMLHFPPGHEPPVILGIIGAMRSSKKEDAETRSDIA